MQTAIQRIRVLALAALVLPALAAAQVPGPQWNHADPASVGWDEAKLEQACDYADDIGTEALLVVYQGEIILSCGDIKQPLRLRSMRKSLLNALVGLLVADGKLSLDATLAELGIDDKTPLTKIEKSATVRDLLTSRSGIYLPSVNSTNEDEMPARGTHKPGEAWFYNNWNFNALGTIVEKASGRSLFEMFRDRIARPIGMQDYSLEHTFYDREDFTRHPAYDFEMSARDLARFGLLYARGGKWGTKQVLPVEWIRESFEPHSKNGPEEQDYGYLWWSQVPLADMKERPIVARGWGYQWIWLFPESDIVIVHQTDYWLLPVQDFLGLLPEPEEAYKILGAILEARPQDSANRTLQRE